MKNSFRWAVLLAIVLITLGIFWLLSPFVNAANSVPNLAEVPQRIVTVLATVINPAPIVKIEDRSQTIVEGARNLGELTTYSMAFSRVGLEARLRFGVNYACEVKEKYAAHGEIKAGVDLQSLQVEFKNDKYFIKVGSPQLTNCHVTVDSYNRTGENQILCPADPEMYKFGLVASTTVFVGNAKEKGILELAQKQAKAILEGFAKSIAGEVPVDLSFEQAGDDELPESCRPSPPNCWQYSGDAQGWVKVC